MSGVIRVIDEQQILWLDSRGTTHACEGTELHPGTFIFWTLCEIDVPAGAAETADQPAVSCPTCRERMALPAPPTVPCAGEAIPAPPGPENFVRLLLRKPGR